MFYKRVINEIRFVLMIMIISAVSACSSDKKDPPFESSRETAPENKHEVYKGPLYQAYRSIQESKYREACDQKLSGMQSELITALDLKSTDLLKQALKQNNHPENYIPFSKGYLVDNPKKLARKGWQNQSYSWGSAYRYYQNAANRSKPWFWQTLDTYVRSLITDDRKRVVYGYNLALNHEHMEKLLSLKEVAEACKTDTRCSEPNWSDDQRKMISEIPYYTYFQNELDRSRFQRDKRTVIEKFFERIESDYNLHKDEYNGMVTHRKMDGKHLYSLPMDASSFSEEDRGLLEKTILSVWNHDSNAVSISWAKSSPTFNLFRFLFDLEPNNRSYVSFALKEIHLFPFTSVRTIAHEFGHVLGFDDHYYTLWDAEKCEYISQYNEEDIMSGSDTGEVTESEWDLLLEQYGYR